MQRLYTTVLSLCMLLFAQIAPAQDINTSKVAISLMDAISERPDSYHSINIVLMDRVDLVAIDTELRAQRANAQERSATVINALKEKSAQTQGRLLGTLSTSPFVLPGTIKSVWISNTLFADAKKEIIAQLSHDPTVEWIGLNGVIEYENASATVAPPFLEPNGIEPGLAAINAPALWAMGYTGYGQLTMTSDTGVDPTHPALFNQYRGHYVPAEETWFEVFQNGNPTGNYTPRDCSDHGTHVTGTMLGLDRLENDTIGVAFNAQWIGAGTLCGIGTADNVQAFEWSLNPDNDLNTVDDMPDVINNSWYDPSINNADCFSVYTPVLEALEVAGIAVVFSAGNAGPSPGTITPPKNINLNEVNVFCVANLNGNNSALQISNGSSRGPSGCAATDSSLVIKPEVAAPGVSVRSCEPGNIYGFKTGTSMAAPHVAGAILLLKEAFPDLNAKDLKLALYHSCTDLGIPGEDNTYGMGIINLLEAFNYLVDQGHTPVSPYRANDVMLVHVEVATFFCDNQVDPSIIVENAGTDTLYNFRVFYKAGNTEGEFLWTGSLAPKTRTNVLLPGIIADNGWQLLNISLTEPNGVADEKPLNNRATTLVQVSDRPSFEAVVEGPDNIVCTNTSALLRGVLPESLLEMGASMDILWYDAPINGSVIGGGEAFTTPLISQEETYYAEVEYTLPVGEKDVSIGSHALMDTTDVGLTFEVTYDMTLEKVSVFKEVTGGVIVRLLNDNDEIVNQKIELSSTTGLLEVELEWDIEPGTYHLLLGGGRPLFFNSEGADYPYSIQGIMSIERPYKGSPNDEAYFFFYDWKVSFKEPCGRTPVTVVPGSAGDAPFVDLTASKDTVYVVDNESVHFNSLATDAVEWYWNFGDGFYSTEENPSHLFTIAGTYLVSLTTVNAEGCSGSATYEIIVEEATVLDAEDGPVFDKILVYPNPASDYLTLMVDLPVSKAIRVKLADSAGQIIKTADYWTNNGSFEIDIQQLPLGLYVLIVETDEGSSAWKVVKI